MPLHSDESIHNAAGFILEFILIADSIETISEGLFFFKCDPLTINSALLQTAKFISTDINNPPVPVPSITMKAARQGHTEKGKP